MFWKIFGMCLLCAPKSTKIVSECSLGMSEHPTIMIHRSYIWSFCSMPPDIGKVVDFEGRKKTCGFTTGFEIFFNLNFELKI